MQIKRYTPKPHALEYNRIQIYKMMSNNYHASQQVAYGLLLIVQLLTAPRQRLQLGLTHRSPLAIVGNASVFVI
jgi:hypothetical protein